MQNSARVNTKTHLWDVRTHDIIDEGFYLLVRVAEFVNGILNLAGLWLALHRAVNPWMVVNRRRMKEEEEDERKEDGAFFFSPSVLSLPFFTRVQQHVQQRDYAHGEMVQQRCVYAALALGLSISPAAQTYSAFKKRQ